MSDNDHLNDIEDDTVESENTSMRVIDLLAAFVNLPIEVLREACRFNPDAEIVTEGCDCWGSVTWVDQKTTGEVTLYREIPGPVIPQKPKTWFTRTGVRVSETHPDAFVEINEDWIAYFAEHERV